MQSTTAISDSDSEDVGNSSTESRNIEEIVARAMDIRKSHKPLLREIINPCIEEDIRKNYRRSIVHRAIHPNMITSTPCVSSAAHQYLNISSISELPLDVENDLENSRAQGENVSNSIQKKENNAIEVLNVSGMKLIDDFKKPLPYVHKSQKKTLHNKTGTLCVSDLDQNKITHDREILQPKERQATSTEGKQRMHSSNLERAESPPCSKVVLGHEANYGNEDVICEQTTPQTEEVESLCSEKNKRRSRNENEKPLNDVNEDSNCPTSNNFRKPEYKVGKPKNIARQRYTECAHSDVCSNESKKYLGNVNQKRSARQRASKYKDKGDSSGSTSFLEKHRGRSDKIVDRKCDRHHSKRKYKRNDSYSSDSEWKRNDQNDRTDILKHRRRGKSNCRRHTKISSRRKYRTSTSSTSSVEYDQSRLHRDSSEDTADQQKSRYFVKKGIRKSRSKSCRPVKCQKCVEKKRSKKYRSKSVATKSDSCATRCSHYKYRWISSESDEIDDSDTSITDNHDSYYSRKSKAKEKKTRKTANEHAEEHGNVKEPIAKIEAQVASDVVKISNSDNSHLTKPRKSLQQMVQHLVNEALRNFETKKYPDIGIPMSNQMVDDYVQGIRAIPHLTQDLENKKTFLFSEDDSDFSFLRTPLIQIGTNNSCKFDTFRPSRSPSISSNAERSFTNIINLKQLARKPIIKSYGDQMSDRVDKEFCFVRKRKKLGDSQKMNGGIQKEKYAARVQTSKKRVPLIHSFRNTKFRKTPSAAERIAINAKLDEVLGISKNASDEKKATIKDVPLPQIMDAETQFSLHSDEPLTNGKINNTSRKRTPRQVADKQFSNKPFTAITSKLSVATQSSPFIDDIVEATNIPVQKYHSSENITNQSDIEDNKDYENGSHIEVIESSNDVKYDLSRNTPSDASEVHKNKLVKSRTKLKFDVDITSNRQSDTISDNVELKKNCTSHDEISTPSSKSNSYSAELKVVRDCGEENGSSENMSSTLNFTPQKTKSARTSGEKNDNIETSVILLESPSPACHLEKNTNVDETEEAYTIAAPHESAKTSDDMSKKSKIKVLQNITLRHNDDILKNSNKPTKRNKEKMARNRIANYSEQENIEELQGVRKSSRVRRPPQVIWWKSAFAGKDDNLFQYYESCARKGSKLDTAKQAEYMRPNTRSKKKVATSTVSKKIRDNKNEQDIPTQKIEVSKKNTKRNNKRGNSNDEPSTSRVSKKDVPANVNNSVQQTPDDESNEKTPDKPANTISCNHPEDNFNTSNMRNSNSKEQENLPSISAAVSIDEFTVPRKRAKRITNGNHNATKPEVKKSKLQDSLPLQNQSRMQVDNYDAGYPTSSDRYEQSNVSASFIDTIESTNANLPFSRTVLKEMFDQLEREMRNGIVEGYVRYVHVELEFPKTHHFGYFLMSPFQSKRAINMEYNTVYFILEGICTLCMGSLNLIKGKHGIFHIKQDTPYEMSNCENVPLVLAFLSFKPE